MCYLGDMDKKTVLERLRLAAPELKALGVEHAYLFGSHARGDADQYSDIDIALEHPSGFKIAPRLLLSLYGLIGERLGDDIALDVVMLPAKTRSLEVAIEKDRVIAF